jgi:drug/metabolite transporter (DMT)-like permease
MGGLFLLTFNIISRTVTFFGIMISSVVQKMSLISPILIGVLFYSENLSLLRITGIIAAVSAIIVINMPFDKGEDNQRKRTMWIYPFLTWLLSSVIDAAFFIIGKTSGKEQSSLFLVILFGTAAILGILFFLIHQRKQETVFPLHIFPLGILLGVPNFMSIYYLMKTISQGWDASLIFPVNNVGIISFSMLGALIIFKETTNKFKIAGIGLAIAAVLLITLS